MSNTKTAVAETAKARPALAALIESSNNTLTEADARAAGYSDEEIDLLKVKLRKVEQMTLIRMQDAEFGRLEKVCVAHENTLPGDLLRQDYWAHVAPQLQAWARIEVRANDRSWLWEGVVLDAGRNWAIVHQLSLTHFGGADIAKTNAAIAAEYAGLPYEVQFRGEFELWSVIRKSDRAVMSEKLATKAAADKYLRERQQADRVPA